MSWIYLHENRDRVRQALQQGYVDEVVTLRATAFDELAAAMHEFGYWKQLECIKIAMDKDEDDVPNELVVRELAVLPLLRIANPLLRTSPLCSFSHGSSRMRRLDTYLIPAYAHPFKTSGLDRAS